MAVTSFEWGVSFQVATFCIILIKVTLAYNISCPTAGHWNLRAKVHCNVTDKYYCLYNPVSERFVEGCNKPVFEGSGNEVRFPYNFNREPCSKNRFQPIKFWTNGSSECIFEKSKCSEQGQVSCNNGKSDTDRECRCDNTKGYEHVIITANTCGCLPTKEDCSCYRQTCQDLGMVLTAENECTTRSTEACQPITNASCSWMSGHTRHILSPQPDINTTDQQQQYEQKQNITKVACIGFIILDKRVNRKPKDIELQVSLVGQNESFIDGNPIPSLVLTNMDTDQSETKTWKKDSIQEMLSSPVSNMRFLGKDRIRDSDQSELISSAVSHIQLLPAEGQAESIPTSMTDDAINNSDQKNESSNNSRKLKNEEILDENIVAGHSGIPEEELNYLRIIYLLLRVAGPVVRIAFNSEINPNKLYTTIANNKKEISQKLKNTNKIDKSQWKYLNPKPGFKYTSQNFDIRFMVMLLDTLVPNVDRYYNNTLSTIKECRNSLTQTATCTLSKFDFENYWNTIGRAIIRIAGENIQTFENFQDMELIRTKEAVFKLNPIEIKNPDLHKLLIQADRYSEKILLQIIDEYRHSRSTFGTIKDLINEQKHNFFHKRRATTSCCDDKCRQKPFIRVIRETDWQKMFIKCKEDTDHLKHSCSSCCERFKVQDNIKYDSELACCLILYTPGILEYTLELLCRTDPVERFLNLNKQALCQTSHSGSMTDTSTVIEQNELKTVYVKSKNSSCDSKCNLRNSKRTETCFCCCRYSARSEITVDSIEENILSKILCVVGPLSVVNSTRSRLFRNFISGNMNHTLINSLKKAQQQLIDIIKDIDCRSKLKKELEDFRSQSVPDDEIIQSIQEWILSQQQATEDKYLVKVMIKDKYTQDPKQLYAWQSWKNLKLQGDNRQFSGISKEENNYLRIVHLMNVVACPAVREKFKKDIWERKKNHDIFYKILSHTTRSVRKPGDAYLTKHNLNIIFQEREEQLSPNHFDLKLLVTLLRLSAECVIDKPTNGHRPSSRTSNEDLPATEPFAIAESEKQSEDPDVKEIDYFRRKIVHSSTGILADDAFNHYWNKISQAAMRLGGPEIKRKCEELTAEKNEILNL